MMESVGRILPVSGGDSALPTRPTSMLRPMAASSRKGRGSSDADEPGYADEVVRRVIMQMSEAMQDSVLRVAEQYGVETVVRKSELTGVPEDAKAVVQELQKLRRTERELSGLVEDLQTEQRVAKERLALYSILTLKLKRELINEKLAHIDTKKEMEEMSGQYPRDGASPTPSSRSASARLPKSPDVVQSRDSIKEAQRSPALDRDDLWTSPDKSSGGEGAGTSGQNLQLRFGSFYSARHQEEDDANVEDEPVSGLQPLRSSLIGQFLPSMLLDSPQLTPTARSESSKHADNHDDSDEDSDEGNSQSDKQQAELEEKLTAFTLSPRADVHRSTDDNQLEHLQLQSRPSTSDSFATTATMASTNATRTTVGVTTAQSTAAISPLTLSLFGELFETIPAEELEAILKDAGGQVSAAIERILQTHPTFNPALAAEVSITGAPTAGGAKGSSHRAVTTSNQPVQTNNNAASNWKTEMCMYYLQGKCNKTRRTCSFAHGESDLVRVNAVKHTSSTNYKSRMCPLWLEGSCPKSRRECPLAHGENDLRDGLALLSQTGASSASTTGTTTNVLPTLPTTAPRLQNYKTELCYYYLKGCCNFTKEECRFAHGESDLRTVESNTLEWSAQLAGAAASSSPVPAPSSLSDKPSAIQLQHQFQQQPYIQQYQPQQNQPQQQSHTFQVPQHLNQGQFVPQGHQYQQLPGPAMHHTQLQAPMMPSPQQGLYVSGNVPHHHQYRYMKGMEEAKTTRRQLPVRRESWSQGFTPRSPEF